MEPMLSFFALIAIGAVLLYTTAYLLVTLILLYDKHCLKSQINKGHGRPRNRSVHKKHPRKNP